MKHLTDEELVARSSCGNRRAMDILVSRYHGKLLDFAFRHLHDREVSADIAQIVLVRVFEHASSFRRTTSFKAWIYTIALNAIRDECRRSKVRNESLSADVDDGEELAARGHFSESPEDAVIKYTEASLVWREVDGLSDNHRSAVILKFRQGLTYEEISEVMGVPVGTAKSWVHYALKTLRKVLEPLECEV